jgi:uncharacterized RDD family membrane protein YckC
MTIDDYVNDVLNRMPAGTPRREQIGTELRGHIAERLAQGRALDDILRDLGGPGALADSYLAEVPLILPPHGRRILAKLVDAVMIICLSAAFAVPAATLTSVYMGEGFVWPVLWLVFLVGGGILASLYTVVLEWRYGYTIGKYLNGLRIVRESGARISFGQSVVRQLPMFLQVGWIDAMFAPFTDRRQRAFELLSKSRCVAAQESTSQQAAFASEH